MKDKLLALIERLESRYAEDIYLAWHYSKADLIHDLRQIAEEI